MRKATTTNAWGLVLDNLPAEKEKEEKKGAPREGKGTEGAGESDDDRCVEALRSQKKTRQGDSEEKGAEIEGKEKKQEVRQDSIFNIQTEGGQLKDQYIPGNREETDEEKEQTEAEDASMAEGISTAKEEEDKEVGRRTKNTVGK